MKPATVDAYVKASVPAEFRPVADKIRKMMREYSERAPEKMRYGMPCYGGAYFIGSKSGITLGFTHGRQMKDKHRLLRGTAKWARHLKLRTPDDINANLLRYYMKQVIALDSK